MNKEPFNFLTNSNLDKSMKYVLIIYSIFFFSCKTETKEVLNKETIELNLKDKVTPPISNIDEVFEFASLIPIRVPEGTFLVDISKIDIYENKYVILDAKYSNVFLFDSKGDYLTNFGKIGSGPGEYKDVADFTIYKDKIYLLSRGDMSLFEYDLANGKFLRKIFLNLFGHRILPVGNNEFLIYTNHNSSIEDSNIFRINLNGEILESYFEYDKNLQTMIIDFSGEFSMSGNSIYFSKPFDEYIYSYDVDGKVFYPKYKTDLLSDFVLENKGDFKILVSPEVLIKSYGGQSFNGNLFMENSDYIIFSFFNLSTITYGIYEKNKSDLIIYAPSSSNPLFRLLSQATILGPQDEILFPIYGEKMFNNSYFSGNQNSQFENKIIENRDSIGSEYPFYILKCNLK